MKTQLVTFSLYQVDINRLNRAAKKRRASKSYLIRNAIEQLYTN